jgi:carboxyl-terminal processing protease
MRDLKAQGMKELVIDLRDNGGGLVFQAYRIANAFLSTGQTVFTQKGRFRNTNDTFQAENPSPDRSPIVLLVNHSTASASEILAGALQDHDRALIAGTNTFGKGLVQNPFEDIGGGSMLLLTIAKYQTPSGRLIQRDYSNGDLYAYMYDGGSLRDDDVAPEEPKGVASKTDIGRSVYSGGGITPDVNIKPKTITNEQDRVERKIASPIFAFALELVLGRVKGFENYKVDKPITFGYDIKSTDFPVTPVLYQQFKQFAAEKYKMPASTIDAEREFVERTLRSELVSAAYGSQTSFQVFNNYDDQLQKAIDLLPQARQLAIQSERARNVSKGNPAN